MQFCDHLYNWHFFTSLIYNHLTVYLYTYLYRDTAYYQVQTIITYYTIIVTIRQQNIIVKVDYTRNIVIYHSQMVSGLDFIAIHFYFSYHMLQAFCFLFELLLHCIFFIINNMNDI
jgi:hypothetical protein